MGCFEKALSNLLKNSLGKIMVKKDPEINKSIKKMNTLVSEIEQSLNKRRKNLGLDKVDLPRYQVSDLFK